MKVLFSALIALLIFPTLAHSQTILRRDESIETLLAQVSKTNLENNIKKLVSFKTRHTLSDTLSKTSGIGAARAWIKSEFERYSSQNAGRLIVAYDAFTQPADGKRVLKPTVLKNVMATLPGTDPEDTRVFMVCGHYDSRVTDVMNIKDAAPGANDDASGVSGVLELARIMSSKKFSATLIFVAMVGEEQGLYGAAHLAKRAKEEGWNLNLLLNNDMIGNTYGMETDLKSSNEVRIFSEGVPAAETKEEASARQSAGTENDGHARLAARYIKEVGERYVDQLKVNLIYRRDRFLRGGDHTPFSLLGFTAVRITEMNEDFNRQHQDLRTENGFKFGDLPEYVDYTYLQKMTRLNLAVLASLSQSPLEPLNVVTVTSALTNQTTLKWDAPKGGKVADYYVLMRETSSPVWEKKFFVKGTTAVLPYSKDNYFFGLQSVDAAGHESLVIMPRPAR
jgi:hypothetical protein